MSITSFLKGTCTQTAVYWAVKSRDGEGGFIFEDPVEISCRWEDMSQLVTDNKGVEITSRAQVYVLQDVTEESYLYLGTLDDLYDLAGESSAGGLDSPVDIVGAYIIKRFQKTPALGSKTEFLRKAYLTPSLSFGGF